MRQRATKSCNNYRQFYLLGESDNAGDARRGKYLLEESDNASDVASLWLCAAYYAPVVRVRGAQIMSNRLRSTLPPASRSPIFGIILGRLQSDVVLHLSAQQQTIP